MLDCVNAAGCVNRACLRLRSGWRFSIQALPLDGCRDLNRANLNQTVSHLYLSLQISQQE